MISFSFYRRRPASGRHEGYFHPPRRFHLRSHYRQARFYWRVAADAQLQFQTSSLIPSLPIWSGDSRIPQGCRLGLWAYGRWYSWGDGIPNIHFPLSQCPHLVLQLDNLCLAAVEGNRMLVGADILPVETDVRPPTFPFDVNAHTLWQLLVRFCRRLELSCALYLLHSGISQRWACERWHILNL